MVAQPVQQLDSKSRRQRHAVQLVQDGRLRLRCARADSEQPISQLVGLLAGRPPARDQVRRAPKIFDQHDSQRDGDGPQLADRERLHVLVGSDESGQQVRVDAAVRVGDERPRDTQHARIAGQRALGQLGQLLVIATRQVVADLPDLRLDDMVVIDQPLCGGRNRVALCNGLRDAAVGLEQCPAVVVQARDQWPDRHWPGGDALRSGQAPGVLLESLRAEDLSTNHLGRSAG